VVFERGVRAWCSRISKKFSLFQFFYNVTQIIRTSLVSLTHIARKSLENQPLSNHK
jgi:hypothetical protein